MQFLFPGFLWALAILGIPIIIHLFHFRRFKRVYFTNVHLLKELKEETSSRNKLRNLLILLTRCAALAFLVFAFAQPIIKSTDAANTSNKAVQIFIDNSFSMNATKNEVPLLTLAKDKAQDLVNSYEDEDIFMLLTHDIQSKHQRFVDRKTLLNYIGELTSTPNVENISTILDQFDRIKSSKTEYEQQVFLISDFQENISQFDTPRDSSVQINLISIRSVQENNVAIIDAYFEAPVPMNNQSNELTVKLANNGTIDENVELRIKYEGQERPLGVISVPANTHIEHTASISIDRTGTHDIEFAIEDFPIQFDDRLLLSFEIKDQIKILSISDQETNSYLSTAFESFEYYNLRQENINQIRYEDFKNQQLIILDDLTNLSSGLIAELVKYVEGGGNLLIFPSINANIESYNSLLAALEAERLETKNSVGKQVTDLNEDEFIFNDVFEAVNRNIRLPQVSQSYSLTRLQSVNQETLLSFRDGSPYLVKHSRNAGNTYLCSTPLNREYNDLVLNAEIFVPMLYKMAISSGVKKPLYYTIGKDQLIPSQQITSTSSNNYMISGPEEFIPGIVKTNSVNLLDVQDQISSSGYYDLAFEENPILRLAFNYDRTESNVRYGDIGKISQSVGRNVTILDQPMLADLSGFVSQRNDGTKLWRWCLILVLIFLLFETLILRFWK